MALSSSDYNNKSGVPPVSEVTPPPPTEVAAVEESEPVEEEPVVRDPALGADGSRSEPSSGPEAPTMVKGDCGHDEVEGSLRSRHRQVDGLPVDEVVCRKCADYDYSGDSMPPQAKGD